jgi:hypothetical protein
MQARYIQPTAVEAQLEDVTFVYDEDGWVKEIKREGSIAVAPKRKAVTVEPDRWGRSWRTECRCTLDRLIQLTGGNLPQAGAVTALQYCCASINRLLDALTYVGGPADLPHVRPDDFWAVRVTYTYGSKVVGSYHAVGLQELWWRGPKPLGNEMQERMRAILREEQQIGLHESLLIDAERKVALGDYRGAVIDAICAVESVLGPRLDALLESRGASRTKIANVLGPSGIGLSDQVHVLLPALSSIAVPAELKESFSVWNSKRNRVVHRGEQASSREAAKALAACRRLVGHILMIEDQESRAVEDSG